jgi:H+-transporting ATPase
MDAPPIPEAANPLLDARYSNMEEHDAEAGGYVPASMTSPGPMSTGLMETEAALRLAFHGPNSLEEKEENELMKLLGFFWGPMPIMIWIAALIEAVNESWPDLAILLALQFFNGFVGYFEEKNAGDAVAALKNSLTPKATVKRDGRWRVMASKDLVPGDVINLKLGDIIPADCKLLEGAPLQVDQAALTGESLPVTMYPGDAAKMGATVKRGEIEAHVTATGSNTFFGKAASMVNSVENVSRFQKVMWKINIVLLSCASVITSIIMIVLLNEGVSILRALAICVVLLVASIPIAMQLVSTSTMAVGARRLAENGVIVSRLGAIEEMAGMNMLCSDKTGTLTQNKLKLYEPIIVADIDARELNFVAALAAKRMDEGMDAIDTCVSRECLSDETSKKEMEAYVELAFEPFDPTTKKTVATVKNTITNKTFKTCKGMCNIVLDMCNPDTATRMKVVGGVQELADRGYRALGVARTNDNDEWEFLGVLSLFDPPREDTKDTIEKAISMGIPVKMVTGDQTAIAKETCRSLGLGAGILNSEIFNQSDAEREGSLSDIVKDAHGFAEVFPEHKFKIVKLLMDQGYCCGMTGDGVNDAPALKRANIGIAVEGATDAARAAADIVLTDPGLKTIIEAILRARKIFARVRNYCIYRISATFQLVFFFFVAVLAFKKKITDNFPDSQRMVAESKTMFGESPASAETIFTLPVIALVAITLLNDGLIISICKDKVLPSNKPQEWHLREIFGIATVLGAALVVSNLCLLLIGLNAGPGAIAGIGCGQNPDDYNDGENADRTKCTGFIADHLGNSDTGSITYRELKTIMYLGLSASGFLTILCARTRSYFFSRRTGGYLGIASIVAFLATTLMSAGIESLGSDLDMDNLSSQQILFVWVWVLVWFVFMDMFMKVPAYKAIDWYYDVEKDAQSTEDQIHLLLSANIEEERLTQRRTSMGVGGRGPSLAQRASNMEHAADSGVGRVSRVTFDARNSSLTNFKEKSERESSLMRDSYENLVVKFAKLEEEMNKLKTELAKKKDKKV